MNNMDVDEVYEIDTSEEWDFDADDKQVNGIRRKGDNRDVKECDGENFSVTDLPC